MAEGDLERRSRRLASFTIDGRAVFARRVTNEDLERKDEMDDEIAELRLRHTELVGQDVIDSDGDRVHVPGKIDECKDTEERLRMRADARELAKQLRDLDALLLKIYVEDESGEPFSDEALTRMPFRDTMRIGQKAASYAFGVEDEDERPTAARNASG